MALAVAEIVIGEHLYDSEVGDGLVLGIAFAAGAKAGRSRHRARDPRCTGSWGRPIASATPADRRTLRTAALSSTVTVPLAPTTPNNTDPTSGDAACTIKFGRAIRPITTG